MTITTPEQMREAAVKACDDSIDDRVDREFVIKAIRAIPTAPQPAAVTVKPLVWVDLDEFDDFEVTEALTVLGRYRVQRNSATGDVFWVSPKGVIHRAESIELAKAAAQADYESRILSALTIHPADPLSDPRVVALVEAARDMRDYGTCLAEQKYHRNLDAALRAIGGEV